MLIEFRISLIACRVNETRIKVNETCVISLIQTQELGIVCGLCRVKIDSSEVWNPVPVSRAVHECYLNGVDIRRN